MTALKPVLLGIFLLGLTQFGVTQSQSKAQFTIDRECDGGACHFQTISFVYGSTSSIVVGIGVAASSQYFSVRITKGNSTKEYILHDDPTSHFIEKNVDLPEDLYLNHHKNGNEKKVDGKLNRLLLDVYNLGRLISDKDIDTRRKKFSETGRYSVVGHLRNYKAKPSRSAEKGDKYQTINSDPSSGSLFMPLMEGVVVVPNSRDSALKAFTSSDITESDDLATLYTFLRNNISDQSEFEKTADYEKRARVALEREVYGGRKGNSIWTGVDRPREMNYNPDAEIMDIRTWSEGHPLMPLGATGIFFTIEDHWAKGFLRNRIALQVINYDDFFRSNSNTRLERYVGHIKIRVSNEDGPSVKSNLRIAYRFRPVKPFTGATPGDSGYSIIFVNLESLRLFDPQSGKVYYDTNLRKPLANPSTPKRK